MGWGLGVWGWVGGGGGMATTTEQTYTQGTVILAMFDESTKNLVWKGTASNTVNPSAIIPHSDTAGISGAPA